MARRAIGEGTIYQRPDGKWLGETTVGWANGQRKRRRVVASTQREARQRLAGLQERVSSGATIASDKLTVGEWLDEWLLKEAKPGVRPRTYEGYAQLVRDHLKPAIGHLKLRSLDARHVRDLMAEQSHTADATKGKRKGKALSPRTIQLIHAVLRRALRRAESYGMVAKNVAMLVSPPPVTREERSPLSPEQSSTFLRSVVDHRLGPLFQTAMATGLRQSELLGLTWPDVDFDKGTLRVERALQRYGKEYHLDAPKTARSRRTIAVPAQVIEGLRQQTKRQKEERLKAGPEWQGEHWNLVFANEAGGPVSGVSVTQAFQNALKRAKLPEIRFHDLRHGTASYLLAAGVELRVVMEVLGHSDIATTANLYAHVLPQLKRDAADKIAEVLFA